MQSIRVHKTQDEDKNKQTNKNTTQHIKLKRWAKILIVVLFASDLVCTSLKCCMCFWLIDWLIDWLIVVSRQVSVILVLFMTCTSLQECGTRIDRCVYYHHRPLLKTDYRRQVVLILQGALHSLQQKSSERICHLKYREVLPKGRYPRREENRL